MGGKQARGTYVLPMDAHLVSSDVSSRACMYFCVHLRINTLMHPLLCVHVSVQGRLLLHADFHHHTNASTWACVDTNQHNNTKAGENALQGET